MNYNATKARRRSPALVWAPTLLLNVALPVATYAVLTGHGVAPAAAYAASGVWPLLDAGSGVVRNGRADLVSVISLVFITVGAATSLAFDDVRLGLVRNAVATGVFGLILLGSLLRERPLMFFFGRRFATDGSPERLARWDGYWAHPRFRHAQRVITAMWAVGFIAEAAVEVVASHGLGTDAALAVNNVLPSAVLAGLIGITVAYGRRSRARASAAEVIGTMGFLDAIEPGAGSGSPAWTGARERSSG
ncbi:MAG TPA: VC0807 family protein [Candidatus Dormibacteraeota bacterium]|nr:VC0807 family protein [Candidatus Dormibacteraeota bacterium]